MTTHLPLVVERDSLGYDDDDDDDAAAADAPDIVVVVALPWLVYCKLNNVTKRVHKQILALKYSEVTMGLTYLRSSFMVMLLWLCKTVSDM